MPTALAAIVGHLTVSLSEKNLTVEAYTCDCPACQAVIAKRTGTPFTDETLVHILREKEVPKHLRARIREAIREIVAYYDPEVLPLSWYIAVSGPTRDKVAIKLLNPVHTDKDKGWLKDIFGLIYYSYYGVEASGHRLWHEVMQMIYANIEHDSPAHRLMAECLNASMIDVDPKREVELYELAKLIAESDNLHEAELLKRKERSGLSWPEILAMYSGINPFDDDDDLLSGFSPFDI